MRTTLLAVAIALVISILPVSAQAVTNHYQLDIPRQPLDAALKDLAKQTGVQIARFSDIPHGGVPIVGPVSGDLSVGQALTAILKKTGLAYRVVNDRTIAVVAPGAGTAGSAAAPSDKHVSDLSAGASSSGEGADGQRAFWSSFVAAQADQGGASSKVNDSNKDLTGGARLEEVVVTAQKRSEKLLDVPVAMTSLSADKLQSLQVNSLTDLDSFVPGLSIASQGAPGARVIMLRGLADLGGSAPTVMTYIDDLPADAMNGAARSQLYGADLQPYYLDHVEVLKGPQGTLYGAASLGGLIIYRLREPNLTQFEARAGSNVEYIDNGSGRPGWGVNGTFSVPLITDSLALRISAFKKDSQGYIENLRLGIKDVGGWAESGGLASLLWKPSSEFSIKATALAQDVNEGNQPAVNLDPNTQQPVFGRLKEKAYFAEPLWNKLRNFALTVNWDIGFATLTSASGYEAWTTQMTEDLSAYGFYCDPNAFPGNVGCPAYPHADALADYVQADHLYKFTHETRLASATNRRVQWMVGAFYTRESSYETEFWPTFTPSLQPLPSPANDIDDYYLRGTYTEKAGFVNLTYEITDRFDVNGGGRHSWYSASNAGFSNVGVLGCPAVPPCGIVHSPGGTSGVSQWMGNARFHLTKDKMFYGRIATGYQPGYFYVPVSAIESGVVRPSKTLNYEAGFKGEFLDKRASLEAAVFRTNWTEIQLVAFDPIVGFDFPANGGHARSTGVELTANYRLFDGLNFTATAAYTDAHLTEDFFTSPGVYGGLKGVQLPYAPLWTASIAVDYVRPLSEQTSLLLGGGYRYKDSVVNFLVVPGSNGYPMGPQNLANLYAGFSTRAVTVRLYGTNVFNNSSYSGLLFVSNPSLTRFVPVQPRTVGVSVDYQFR